MIGLFFVVFGLFLVFPAPKAEAGIFSFLGSKDEEIISVENIQDNNSQNVSLLQSPISSDSTAFGGGDILILEDSVLSSDNGPLGTAADLESINEQGGISVYIVKEKETLKDIAKMFGVSVNTIVWANDLTDQKVKAGQTLVILPITGIEHTIKKGDTLKSIAKKYSADIDDIGKYNGLTSNSLLSVGDEIIIPDGEIIIKSTAVASSGKKKEKTWGTNTPEYSGYYIRPISGGRKSQGLHGYNGIDLAAPTGTTIMASAAGVVIVDRRGGWGGGYGNYLVIAHDNGTQTLYAHNSKNLVTVGEKVYQGQAISLMGSTGRSTGSHVHFEIRGAKNPF